MRTGILGGTFDPIHNAHLMIADNAIKEYDLDKILIMPSPNPPHKSQEDITSVDDRVNMIKLAIKDNDKLIFSNFELGRKGNVYSADTIKMYKELHPDEELFFIIGSDSLYTIDSWYHPEIIFDNATILVSRRDDASQSFFIETVNKLKKLYSINIEEIKVNISNISSTKIRNYSNYEELKKWVPLSVAEYIRDNKLYITKRNCRLTNADIISDLKEQLNEKRFIHTLNVADTAKKIAEVYGENPNKAYLAGLLHDCAKCNEDDVNLNICQKSSLDISEYELNNPFMLHGKAGAVIAATKYHVTDKDILNSITYHTTGRPDMSLLEKIIFVADYIEPGRTVQKNLSRLRDLAYKDLDKTVLMILQDTLDYLSRTNGSNIDKNTITTYNYYSTLKNQYGDNEDII